jgi:hypothetical protein
MPDPLNPDIDNEMFFLWHDDYVGPFKMRELFKMAGKTKNREEWITPDTLYFSNRLQSWQRLGAFATNEFSDDTVTRCRSMGVKQLRFLGAGVEGECGECIGLDGKIFSIDDLPQMPPASCACLPWCRATVVAEFPP